MRTEIRAAAASGSPKTPYTSFASYYLTGLSYPQNVEPSKCEGWTWKSWEEINTMAKRPNGVQELFLPVENLVRGNPQLNLLMNSARQHLGDS